MKLFCMHARLIVFLTHNYLMGPEINLNHDPLVLVCVILNSLAIIGSESLDMCMHACRYTNKQSYCNTIILYWLEIILL